MTPTLDEPQGEPRPPFPVVAFLGYAGQGKTTAAQFLRGLTLMDAEPGEPPWVINSFAAPLKSMLVSMNPLVDEAAPPWRIKDALSDWSEEEVKQKFPEYRRLMQTFGEAIKSFDPLFFARMGAEAAACAASGHYSGMIFDDLRFPSELEALKSTPGLDVHTIRIGDPNPSGRLHMHHSETSMDTHKPDFIIRAETLGELEAGVEAIYEGIVIDGI